MKTIKDLNDYLFSVPVYSFTADELNEYTAKVIKKALETAAEKALVYIEESRGHRTGCVEVEKESITNTFEETFKQFKV